MGRFLLLAAVVVVAIWLIRRAVVNASRAKQAGSPPAGAPAGPGKTHGELVKCAQCGTHLPLAEARAVGYRLYCSDEHARLGPRIGSRDG
jgi:uncharacterized protein